MAGTPSRLIIRLALDPLSWRAEDKGAWAMRLAEAAGAAAPHLLCVENYEIGDTLVYIRLRSPEEPKRLRKLVREGESFRRLRARLADLDTRPDFDVEADRGEDHDAEAL